MSKMSNDPEIQKFWSFVSDILNKYEGNYKKSLEDYLISLWVVIEKHKSHLPSYSLFASMIDEAFVTQPRQFDKRWLAYERDLFWDYQDDSYVIKEHKNGTWVVTAINVDDFEILKHTILFQIADLHRMPGEKLNDPQRYFGIQSPTGNTWYNFTPFDYWECATRGMEDHLKAPQSMLVAQFSKCTWALLAALLSLGQLYE